MYFKKITLLVAMGALVISMSAGVAYGASDNNQTSNSNIKSVNEKVGAQDKVTKHRGGCSTQFAEILNMDANALSERLKSGETLAKIAAEKGIDVKTLTSKLEAQFTARIDKAVESGKLTQEKAVEMKSNTPEKVTKMINEPMTGRQGKAGKGKMFMNVRDQIPVLVGMENAAQLEEQFKSGKTLVDIAKDKGIAKDKLVSDLQSLMKANLDQAVNDKKITAEKAATIESKMPQMIERIVTRVHKEKVLEK